MSDPVHELSHDDSESEFLESQEEDIVEDLEVWTRLLHQLRSWETERWHELSKSMGMREMEEFSRLVIEAGECAGCRTVKAYGNRLLGKVRDVDLGGQERSLAAYPDLVKRVSRIIDSSRQA